MNVLSSYTSGEYDVVVPMGEWDKASDNLIIGTMGLGPCVGVAIFDPANRTGYVAHSNGGDIYPVERMLLHIGANITNPAALKGWAGGAQLLAEYDDGGACSATRREVIQKLNNLGIKDSLIVKWIEDRDETQDMALDCGSGECAIISYSQEEIIEELKDRNFGY